MKAFLSTMHIALLCTVGCMGPVSNEIDYRAVLSDPSVEISPESATLFADQLAEKDKLEIVGHTLSTPEPAFDPIYSISLKAPSVDNLVVTILFNHKYNIVTVTISGNIENQKASVIGRDSVEIFANMFPGSTLTPFVRHETLMGP